MVDIKKTVNSDNLYEVTFSYQPYTAGKHQIFLAGEFNDFSPDKDKFQELNGIYYCTLLLPKGKYSYKFIVDSNWIPDVAAEEIAADGFGGHNSLLYVGDPEKIKTYRLVKFRWSDDAKVNSIYIAGSFNNWQENRDELFRNDNNEFEILIPLQPGKYNYRFIVNGNWQADPQSEKKELNAFGQYDSVIYVDEKWPDLNSYTGNKIITYALAGQDKNKLCSLHKGKSLIRTFSYKNNCNEIELILKEKSFPLTKIDSNHCCDYYQTELNKTSGILTFAFLYKAGNEQLFLGQNGFMRSQQELVPFSIDLNELQVFETPDWVKQGIIYQIFVDRFYNGDPALNQDFSEWYYEGLTSKPETGKKLPSDKPCYHFVNNWYDHSGLRQSPFHKDGIPDHFSFYGGDLQGIRQKLDYLTDLGITILYLNPIFAARSNHKYDCSDYRKVDPHFGTADDFKKLVKEARQNGIRIIIDVAFNHTGDTFWAFRDAAQKGPESPYYHWFEWKQWPLPAKVDYNPSVYYNCWWGLGHMPDLDYDRSRFTPAENPIKNIDSAEPNWDVVNYILDTAEFWLKEMDIDGFRLDVPNEVPFWFWELFRKKVKQLKPDAYLVGEIWHNATEWTGPRYFDAVMNYACFKDPVIQFFNLRKGSAEDFDKALKPGLLDYQQEATLVMMNLLDSHDTFRYLEIAQGDLVKLKMALIFQMTYIGTPHIWYGDEIGMRGAHDPDCRRPFNWKYESDQEKVDLLNFYRELIRIRKNNPVLIYGGFQTLFAEGKLYAYSRKDHEQEIIVVLNNHPESQVISLNRQTDSNFTDLITKRKYLTSGKNFSIQLEKYSGIILLKE